MRNSENQHSRLVIVSNRLPFSVSIEDDTMVFTDSSGGLVTGLGDYLKLLPQLSTPVDEYLWVGWPGATIGEQWKEKLRNRALAEYHSHPVFLTESEMDNFYHGFCNKTIWPLFQYVPSYTSYTDEYWHQYRKVNEVFCDALIEVVRPNDVVWIQDYHLMLLPRMLKARTPNYPIGFFLHIPFPSFEMFRLLPGEWRNEILEGLLGADLVGFHTYEYVQHFLQCVLRIRGYEHDMGQITVPGRIVKVDTFPMGIDYTKFADARNNPDVIAERDKLQRLFTDVKIIVSVDRLDYTKGILHRLEAYELMLKNNPHLVEKVVLVMVVVPSRIGIEHYDQMKRQIEEAVGRINGAYGSLSWRPIEYQYRKIPFTSLAALYSIGDVALVTPLRDGMNLIAKEFVATKSDGRGVLVLSEMAGAAKELGEAILVNPNSRQEVARGLVEAIEMPEEEQKRRLQIMQDRLCRYDVKRWAMDFLNQLTLITQVQLQINAKVLTPSVRRQWCDEYQGSSNRLLLLDYDGTLVPFAKRPQLAKPGERILKLLTNLAADQRNTIVLISGRGRDVLQKWFGTIPVALVAEHGVWVRETNDIGWCIDRDCTVSWKEHILPILQLYADRLPGALVEEKEYSVSWHYRAADLEQGCVLSRELTDHFLNFTANLPVQVVQGNRVVELRTAGANKGTAALRWLARGGYDFILAMGDDVTDEDLFAVLPKQAHSVKVGVIPTRAQYNVHTPNDVVQLLLVFAAAPPKELRAVHTTIAAT